MWTQTDLTRRLELALPIVQGPFGSGLSAVDLVVEVSEAGGLGSFGVHHLERADIRDVASAIRARTQRPFAMNLWIPLGDADDPRIDDAAFARAAESLGPYFRELNLPLPRRPERFAPPFDEQIEAIFEARPAVFSFVFGIPAPAILARCRELDIFTLGAATTPDEAVALERAGADAVVATGLEAGGHRVSFLRPPEMSLMGTLSLVPQVVAAVTLPVIAAGGIADGRGLAAALTLGAQAAQIGTAFLGCDESAASEIHRDKLHSSDARHTLLTRAASGRLARGIENRFLLEMQQATHIAQYPVQAWLTARLKQAAIQQGRSDLLVLWCGQSAPLLRHRKARALMQDLRAQADAAFALRTVHEELRPSQ